MSRQAKYSSSIDLTKREANDVLNYQMIKKNWWVDDCNNNVEILQQVLDILFNKDGSDYVADIQESAQSHRLVINCKICSKTLSSLDPFLSHDNGKTHKKAVSQALPTQKLDVNGPLCYKKLDAIKGTFSRGSLEDRLDYTIDEMITGMQFIYKWKVYSPKESYMYKCNLCKTSSYNDDEMFYHIISTEHNHMYLVKKFRLSKDLTCEAIRRECSKIMAREGRVNFKIVDFSKQLSDAPPDIRQNDDDFKDALRDFNAELSKTNTSTMLSREEEMRKNNTNMESEDLYIEHEIKKNHQSVEVEPSYIEDEYPLNKFIERCEAEKAADGGNTMFEMLMDDKEAQELVIQTMSVLNWKLAKSWKKKQLELDPHPPTIKTLKQYASKLTFQNALLKPSEAK